MLFRLENVSKEFSGAPLFRDVTIQCHPGDRIGLVGRNGSGKTTLLDVIEGTLSPERGTVRRLRRLSVSRLTQTPHFNPKDTVLQAGLQVFRRLQKWEKRLQQLEAEMSHSYATGRGSLAEEYGNLRERFEAHGGYQYRARTQAVLNGLGLSGERMIQPCANLSGGQESHLLLAQSLLSPADLLLLDEPTNHLDLDGIVWLIEFLQSLPRGYVLVSHDRYLLDQVTTRTWEIESSRLHDYPVNYTRSRELRRQRVERQNRLYQKQQEWKDRTEEFIRRNLAGQKTRQAQSRRKQLEKTRWLQPHPPQKELDFEIPEGERGAALTLGLHNATFGYPNQPLIEDVELEVRRGERVAILGGNGSGKTTLLRTLLGEIPALEGEVKWGVNVRPAYFSQNPDPGKGTVYDALRELDSERPDQQIRQLAARFLFEEDHITRQITQLSGGEKARLALARLFLHPSNMLLLDEPTNHLDIPSREALEKALHSYPGNLLVISHDLYLMRRVAQRFWVIRDRRIEELRGLDELWSSHPSKPPPRRAPKRQETPKGHPRTLSKNERQRREQRLIELETELEAVEKQQRELLEVLQDPQLAYSDRHQTAGEHRKITQTWESLYAEWEAVSASPQENRVAEPRQGESESSTS